MDKKKKTYLLLVAVLGLWGTIGYKVVSALSPEESEALVENVSVGFSPEKTKIDTFSIAEAKRDPFLEKLLKLPNRSSQSKRKTTTKNPDVENPWPQVQYQGMVKKQGATSEIFIITINQQEYLLKKSQEIEAVKLVNGSPKEIKVRFDKETKIIAIQ